VLFVLAVVGINRLRLGLAGGKARQ
jgi:hypothetical protein